MSEPLPFQEADHIFIDCGGYSHHGIYVGDGNVVHYDSTPARKLLGTLNGAPPRICEVPIAEFAGDKVIHIREYSDETLDSKASVEMAKSRVGEKGYDLCGNNCEHFAVWCKTGNSHSTQVESARRTVTAGAAGIAMGTAIVRSAKVLPGPYKLVAYGAGAAIAIGSTTYRFLVERNKNRMNKES